MGLRLIVQLILVCNVHYVLGQGTTPSTTKAPSSSAATTAATPATTVSTVSTASTASTGSPATTLSTVSSASTVSTVSAVTQPSTVSTTITASPVTTSTSGSAASSTQTSVSATTGTTSSISTQQTPGTNNGNGATTASTISTVSTSSTTVSSATPSSSVSTQQTPATTASSVSTVSTQQTPGTTASTVSTPQTPSTCTANQTFASVGFDCFTCANQTGQCRIKTEEKCYCNQGYVLSKTGCVLPIDCKAEDKCFGNETYATSGIDCLTCGNYKDATCGPINMSKCYCNIGYVRNDEGKCVKMGDCSVTAGDCKVNQTMQNSGFDCLSCDNYNDTNIQCGLVNERNCFCNNGYYRTADRQRCVLPQDCNSVVQPNSCSTNETYSASGNECKCGAAQQCPFTRGPKCYCNSGFYRTPTGGCVLQQDCPSDVTCKSLAERECNGGCIRTCGRTYTRRLRCPAVCNSCLCPFGQLRDDYSGLCIAVKSCPNTGYIFPNFVYNP